ncbi:MAG: alcohol dehydrogenase catalytic domain-containing protein [Thermoguttaceae bacterium]|jgi:L-iditol 2-dehydrogenase
MRVAYFTGLRQLEIAEAPKPELDRPDAVLLRIDRVGICGSDVHYYTGGRIGDQVLRYPETLGHECAGTVMEVGPAVKGLVPGNRVAVDPAIACGQCDQCRAGRVHTCRRLQFMGSPGQAPGAMAEYRVIPARNCFPIPDAMSLDQAALIEPLSIGLYATRLAGLGKEGQERRIAVLGTGPIGLCVLLAAKAAGPSTVYATDLLDERLAVARQCGADWTGNPRREDVAAAIARHEPHGLDLVFECSGDPTCIDLAQGILAPGGTLLLVGIPEAQRVDFDVHRMRRAELAFKSVRRQNGCIAPAIQMVSQGRIDAAPLVTHRYAFDQVRAAFELVAGYRDGVIKAVVRVTAAE